MASPTVVSRRYLYSCPLAANNRTIDTSPRNLGDSSTTAYVHASIWDTLPCVRDKTSFATYQTQIPPTEIVLVSS